MAIGFSNAWNNTATGSNSVAVTVSTSDNNTVVIVVAIATKTSTVSTIEDNATGGSSVYKKRVEQDGSGNARVEIWSTGARASKSATTVTVTLNGSSDVVACVGLYTGVQAIQSNTSRSVIVNSLNPFVDSICREAGDFHIGGFASVSNGTYSAGSNTNLRTSNIANSIIGGALADRLASISGCQFRCALNNTSTGYAVASIALRPVSTPEPKISVKLLHWDKDDEGMSGHGPSSTMTYSRNSSDGVYGGYNVIPFTQKFNTSNQTWTDVAQMPLPAWGGPTVAVGKKVYYFSGLGPGNWTQGWLQIYDTETDTWRISNSIGPPQTYSYGTMGLAIGTDIWLLSSGGYSNYGCVTKYDTLKDTFTVVNNNLIPSRNPRWSAAAYFSSTGLIYIAGGVGPTNDVSTYNPATNTWTSAYDTAPYSAWGQPRQALYDNTNNYMMYTLGFNGSTFNNNLYKYNPVTKTWGNNISNSMLARDGVAGALSGTDFYIIGGRSTSDNPVSGADKETDRFDGTDVHATTNMNHFASDVDAATVNIGGTDYIYVVSGYGGKEGCAQIVETTQTSSDDQLKIYRSNTGETWETWGVPKGAKVIAVGISAINNRTTAVAGTVTSITLSGRIINVSGNSVHSSGDLIPNYACGTTATTTWTSTAPSLGTTISYIPIDEAYQKSDTDVRIQLQIDANLTNGSFTLQLDGISVQLIYTGDSEETDKILLVWSNGNDVWSKTFDVTEVSPPVEKPYTVDAYFKKGFPKEYSVDAVFVKTEEKSKEYSTSTTFVSKITQSALTSGLVTGASYAVTSSISPTANSLILLAVDTFSFGSIADIPVITYNGTGLTFELVDNILWEGNYHRLSLFRALGASPTSGTIRIQCSKVHNAIAWCISEFHNVDTKGLNGIGAIVHQVKKVSSGSVFFIDLPAFQAPNNATYMATAQNNNETPSPESPLLMIHDVPNSMNNDHYNSWWQDTPNTSPQITNTNGATTEAGIAVELRAKYGPPFQPYNADVLFVKLGIEKGYSTGAFFYKTNLSTPYSLNTIFSKADIPNSYSVDSTFQGVSETYDEPYTVDVFLIKYDVTKSYQIDTLIEKSGKTEYSVDVIIQLITEKNAPYTVDGLFFKANVEKPYSINAVLVTPGEEYARFGETRIGNFTLGGDVGPQKQPRTKEYSLNSSIEKQDIIKTYSLNALLKKLSAEKTFSVDSFIKRFGLEKTYSSDSRFFITKSIEYSANSLFKKLGVEKPTSYDVIILAPGAKTKGYSLDALFKKLNILSLYQINVFFQSKNKTKIYTLDVIINKITQKSYSIDLLLKKFSVRNQYLVSSYIEKSFTKTYDLNSLFRKFNLSKTYTIDGIVVRTHVQKTYSIDTVMKAFGIRKTYIINSYFKKYGISTGYFIDVNIVPWIPQIPDRSVTLSQLQDTIKLRKDIT